MAVANIDTVYQRVLALANKEQRGYITPQEFNLLAGKAQNDIFEMYFHDYKTALLSPGNRSKSSDDADMLREKISMHRVINDVVSDSGSLPSEVHWLESIYRRFYGNRVYTITAVAGSNINLAESETVSNSSSTYISLRYYNDGTGASDSSGEYAFPMYFTSGGALISTVATQFYNSIPIVGPIATDTATQVAGRIAHAINDHSPYHTATYVNEVVTITYTQDRAWTGAESIANAGGLAGVTSVANANGADLVYEEVDRNLWQYIKSNTKLKPSTQSRGIFQRTSSNMVELLPNPGVSVLCDYIKRPTSPKWGYVVVGDKALHNPAVTHTTPFALHSSEESTLTNKILELAGIVINKPGLSEVILRNEAVKEANENK